MSKPRMIKDHGNWIGAGSGNLPIGVKKKEYANGEGAGHLDTYEQTQEDIKAKQDAAVKKVHGHGAK